jgi:hypothetical protein
MDILALYIIEVILAALAGFIIGRIGDYYVNFWIGDPNWVPDHWTYGLLLMIIGLLFFHNNLEILIFSFGVGILVSDLRDCCNLKFFGSDGKTKDNRKFWHID